MIMTIVSYKKRKGEGMRMKKVLKRLMIFVLFCVITISYGKTAQAGNSWGIVTDGSVITVPYNYDYNDFSVRCNYTEGFTITTDADWINLYKTDIPADSKKKLCYECFIHASGEYNRSSQSS